MTHPNEPTSRKDDPPSAQGVAEASDTAAHVAAVKAELISRLEAVEDPAVLSVIEASVEGILTDQRLDEFDQMLAELLDEPEDEAPLEKDLEHPEATRAGRLEARLAPWTFALSCVSLVVFGLILILVPDEEIPLSAWAYVWLPTLAGGLGLFFVIEFALIARLLREEGRQARPGYMRKRWLLVLFPPARFGVHSVEDSELIWLPFWGWSRVNHQLFETLRRKFSGPMIIIALLIVPILLIEWKFMHQVDAIYPGGMLALRVSLQIVQALIWAAFAFEFFLMVSIADDKVDYCKQSWLDILIILLPLISFFRSARVLRAVRLNQLARGYRLRGVLLKARQALLVAEVIQRLIFPNPEKQIADVKQKLKKNRRQRAELERLGLMAIERLKAKRAGDEAEVTQDETEQGTSSA